MTDTPSIAAQIGALREPGWYWVRVFEGAPWHPYHWYHSRDGEAFWIGRAVDDEPMAEIGPRIPDPVTLQQRERAMKVVEAARRYCDATKHGEEAAVRGGLFTLMVAALDAAETETGAVTNG